MSTFANTKFTFQNPGKLVYGKNSIKKAGAEALALGAKRLMIVTDGVLGSTSIVGTAKSAMGDALAAVFDKVVPDSDISIVNEGAALAREHGADGIVSIGGGSSIDTAKAIAVLLTKGDSDVTRHLDFFKVGAKIVPHVAVPTTAGTGSEVTGMAVIKDRRGGVKRLLVDNYIIPPVAILDPALLVSLPPAVTAATGMDAMTHAIEAMVSTNHMPPADGLAAFAISELIEWLPKAVAQGDDLEARGRTLIAATLAGQAFHNAYVGVVHAMAHALGGKFDVPHGLANALLLPACMEYNIPAAADRLAMVAWAMGLPRSGSVDEDARGGIRKIEELIRTIGLPRKLSAVGVKEEGIKDCASLALVDAAIFTNPRKPEGPDEIVKIYKSIY